MASDLSENLVEIAAEQLAPEKWAMMQLMKGGRPDMTAAQGADLIERIFREGFVMASAKLKADCIAACRGVPHLPPGIVKELVDALKHVVDAYDFHGDCLRSEGLQACRNVLAKLETASCD